MAHTAHTHQRSTICNLQVCCFCPLVCVSVKGSRAKVLRHTHLHTHSHTPTYLYRRVLGVDATSAQTLASLAMVLKRMHVELIITRVTRPSIRRLLGAHGIISPEDAAAAPVSSSSGTGAAGGSADAGDADGVDPELQQPLLQEQDEEAGNGGYCRVFDTLSGGAKYAEDRCVED